MKKIILDTNFIMIPFMFKVDIFSEIERIMPEKYEICIIDKTMDELIDLEKKLCGADKKAAKMAKSLINVKNVTCLKTEKHLNTDKLIVETAKETDAIVATQDMALKKILKENKTPLIILRQKKHLELIL